MRSGVRIVEGGTDNGVLVLVGFRGRQGLLLVFVLKAATTAMAVGVLFVLLDGLSSHNSSGDGYDGVAKKHDEGGDELAGGGDGCDVAIADGGDGDDGPVDATGDAGDGRVDFALDAIHGGSQNDGKNEDEHHKDDNLDATAPQGVEEETALVEETLHPKNAEDAEHTHESEDGKGGGGGDKQTEPRGEDGEEVDNAVEGEDVAPGLVEAVDAEVVLEGEKDGEDPANDAHGEGEPLGGAGDTFQHDDDDVECDEYEQPDVELLTGRGVGFEDDGIDLLLGEGSVAFGQEYGEESTVQDAANEVDYLACYFGVGDTGNPANNGLKSILYHNIMSLIGLPQYAEGGTIIVLQGQSRLGEDGEGGKAVDLRLAVDEVGVANHVVVAEAQRTVGCFVLGEEESVLVFVGHFLYFGGKGGGLLGEVVLQKFYLLPNGLFGT